MLSGAVFYKKIYDAVTTTFTQAQIAGEAFGVERAVNGAAADIYGPELGLQHFFDNGFGILANGTFTESSIEGDGDAEGVIPFSFNISGVYDRGPFTAQVTYSYVDAFTEHLYNFVEGLPVIERKYEDLSFSASYALTENYAVFVEGSNVLNEVIERYNTYSSVPAF